MIDAETKLAQLTLSVIRWANENAAASRRMAVQLAKQADVCRICLKKPKMPLQLNYGEEYACAKCSEGREWI